MDNFIYDNTPLPAAKSDVRPPTDPTHQWSASDANTVFNALADVQAYLRGNNLNATDTVTVKNLSVVDNTNPLVQPAIDLVGLNGKWFVGMDTANVPTNRDFVPVALRSDYFFNDGVTTSGSPTLTSASQGGFKTAMVGAALSGAGIPAGTTVLSVGGTTTLTMSANATASTTNVRVAVATGATLDLEYWKHRGALSPTCGIGITPPDGQARLQVGGQDDEPTMGNIRLRRGPSQTANLLTLHDSTPTDRVWFDKDFYLSGSNAGNSGAAFVVAADATNQRAVCWTGSDKATLYGFNMPTGSGGVTRFSCISGGANSFDVGTNGSFRHLSTNLGFFGASTTTKPTVTGSRGGNAALASLLTALAGLGLITDSTTV